VDHEAVNSDSPSLSPGQARSAKRLLKRSIEAAYDASAWVAGLFAAGWAVRDVSGAPAAAPALGRDALSICVLSLAAGWLTGLYRGRYHRGSLDELAGIAIAGGLMTVVLAVLGEVLAAGQQAPLRTVAGGALVVLPVIVAARFVLYAVRQRSRSPEHSPATDDDPDAVKVIVFGAGDAGAKLISRLLAEPDAAYRPVALLDDDPRKRRLRIRGIPVMGDRTRMTEVAAATGATVLVIAIAKGSGTAIRDLSAWAERCGLTPKVVPTVSELLSGSARIEGIRDPRISDLLGRRPVRTDIEAVAERLRGKRVLVTGAGGSIGSELCRQLHRLNPAELIMLDRDESALHEIQLTLYGRALLDSEETVLADIRDRHRIREVFERSRPQIVFHAAALKHLPLLERYPAEAVKSNVWGTQYVLEAAAACGIETFVNISTDKAADPVSVLGYSKRIAERLTAHMAAQASGSYLSVRFGNVLGSRGSVLGALSAQAAAGGPLTVTHPDVTRYFMTGDEAVQLVLQATVIGGSGGVLVLDMGQPVRIADIARRLSARSAYQADIVFTGLRSGEKLTEDLVGRDEVGDRTRHPLMQHVPVPPLSPGQLADLESARDDASLRASLARCAVAMPQLAVPRPAGAGGQVAPGQPSPADPQQSPARSPVS
jgi:FlaA1/EpsC-like NDP-sugar epimerase